MFQEDTEVNFTTRALAPAKRPRTLVANIGVMEVGLNLTAANVLIKFEIGYLISNNHQVIIRIHRLRQQKPYRAKRLYQVGNHSEESCEFQQERRGSFAGRSYGAEEENGHENKDELEGEDKSEKEALINDEGYEGI